MAAIATTIIEILTAIAMGAADSSLSFAGALEMEKRYAGEDQFYNVPQAVEEALSRMD
jgi:hypothetical protein